MNGVQARTGGKCRVGVNGAIGRMCEKKGIRNNERRKKNEKS